MLVSAAVVVFFGVKTFPRCLCSYELLVNSHGKNKKTFSAAVFLYNVCWCVFINLIITWRNVVISETGLDYNKRANYQSWVTVFRNTEKNSTQSFQVFECLQTLW